MVRTLTYVAMYLPYYVDCLALSRMKDKVYWLRIRRTLFKDIFQIKSYDMMMELKWSTLKKTDVYKKGMKMT